MRPTFAVLNLNKSAFDESTGLVFGGVGKLNETATYGMSLHTTLDAAIKQAESMARGDNVGVIFELLEAHAVPAVPVKVFTTERINS